MLLAIQLSVPVALPADPVEFVQVTSVTPALSVASPFSVMVGALVAMMVAVGYVMRSEGGVVFPGELGGAGAGGGAGEGAGDDAGAFGRGADCCCCRVTMMVCVARSPEESDAVIVMVLARRLSGTDAMAQLGAPVPLPI